MAFMMFVAILVGTSLVFWVVARALVTRLNLEPHEGASAHSVVPVAHATAKGHCMLCNAPLRPAGALNADAVVSQIEWRILADISSIEKVLQQRTQEGFRELYQA